MAPDALALAAPGRTSLSFRGLCDQVAATVREFNRFGLGRHDRIALVLPDGPELLVAFLAAASAATAAPLNPAYTAREFEFYLDDVRARAVVVLEGLESPVRAVASARGLPRIELAIAPDGLAGNIVLRGAIGGPPARPGLAQSRDPALVLHTSGTTARPKLVPLSHTSLLASATSVCVTLGLRRNDRCLGVMPLFHVHGLVASSLASLTAGAGVIVTPGFQATEFYRWVDECAPTWYTAVPTMHRAILDRAPANTEIIARSRLRLVRSSSASLPPSTLAELEATFGVPVIEAYGMTETAHQIASNPLPPGRRKPGSVGRPSGPEVAIVDETWRSIAVGERGEVAVRGTSVVQAYERNPEANARSFRDGWFRTGDEGYFDGDGYLYLTGRLKEIINRAGEKIAPREVDDVLIGHPAVRQAVAFAVPDARLGEDVAAAVVLRDDAVASEADLRAFAAERLAPFKVPSRIVMLDELPKGPTGKLQRIGLAQTLGLDARAAAVAPVVGEPVAPRNAVEEAVAGMVGEVLGLERIGVTDDFFALGGDSVLAMHVAARMRRAWQIDLPLPILFETPTVAGLAITVEDLLLREFEDEQQPEA